MKINQVLKKQLENINIDKDSYTKINKISKEFIIDLKNKLKKNKINAEVFIGGSLAKDTLVKTEDNKYDVDIFVRFNCNCKDNELSKRLGKIIGKAEKIHGSRDYYQIIKDNIIIEVIPVIKIKKPEESRNVTDLSYFHVNYIKKQINKNKRLANEIKLAKAFCHAQDFYGAESYIKGFSGYSLELLISHYKSFLKFIKAIDKLKEKKDKPLIIDDNKFYKKNEVLMELNESKLQSPIILIDPTFKQRNALSGLSKDTFKKFKKSINQFLKNPGDEFFRKKNKLEELKKKFKDIIIISLKTSKQKGDIAGTKSKKFYKFFISQLEREFKIIKSDFDYNEEKNIAYFYLVLDRKNKEIIKGPPITVLEHLTNFKKVHANAFIKEGFAYAEIEHNLNFNEFLDNFNNKEKKIMNQMSIKEIKLEE